MVSIRSILVPIDGSHAAIAALEHAVAFAQEHADTRIDTLHVEEPEQLKAGSVGSAPGAQKEENRVIDAALERARARLGDRISTRKVAGDPLRSIIEIANKGTYELIVMGTHGRSGRLHMMLGSVAAGVVRNAPCPVLTVREPGEAYRSFAGETAAPAATRAAP